VKAQNWKIIPLAVIGCLAALTVAALEDEGPIVADIIVEGGVTLTLDTVSYYLGLEPGDPLDREAVAEGFHRLWDSGLFESVRIDVEPLDDEEVNLYITVTERPFVSALVFEGNKKLSTTTLKDKLDEKGIELPRNVPLKMATVSRIETALGEVYDSEGYRSAAIDYRIEDVSRSQKRIVFVVDEGGKVKIDDIEFAGNEVYGDWRLKMALKEIKQTKWYRFMGDKIIYSKEAWDEDRENLRTFYLNHGYKDIKIGQPEVILTAKNPDAATLKKKKYRLKVIIPVEEGEPYLLGELRIEGVEVLNPESIKKAFDVSPGKPYRYKAIDAGMETIQNVYHNQGYIYAYTNQVMQDREGEDHVVDVVIDVFEGERYRLGRIEFAGNTVTKDKVLRREFRIPEGTWMSMGALRASVFKVNALGYWKLEDEPLDFDFDDENKLVNVVVKGHEVGRNDVQFGAGYSELDGFFAQAMFNTRNFLGRGETLGVSIQVGRRADYYTLSFTEPYFLDRRILLGGSIYKTNLEVINSNTEYYREVTGAGVTFGLGTGAFSSFSTLLSFENVFYQTSVFRTGGPGDPTGGHIRPIDPPPTDPVTLEKAYDTIEGRTVSITPGWTLDSRDDPFDPNQGRRFTIRSRFAGGPLGGDYDYIRPELSLTYFHPLTKRTVGAFNLEVGQFFTYDDGVFPDYERYRLGGDRSIRGIPYYTVVPRTEHGIYFLSPAGAILGGDRYWLFNLEYQFKIGGPVKFVLFTDIGNTYHELQGWNFDLYRQTVGAELRIFLPIFQAPIRFIYGYNLDPFPDEESSDFEFSIGTTF